MRSLGRFMEHFWLAVTIGTLIAACWAIYSHGFREGRSWLWFPLIASAMWVFRRFTRRRMEAWEERQKGGRA